MELNYRDREKTLLDRELWLSREDRSRMTLISGEPLSGKTSLSICQAREALVLEGKRHVHPDWLYFKAGGRSENLLVRDFREEVAAVLKTYVPEGLTTLSLIFPFLMKLAENKPFSLIIDGVDEAGESFIQTLRSCWSEMRDKTRMNLVMICNSGDRAEEIFGGEMTTGDPAPLKALVDRRIRLRSFSREELREILGSALPGLTEGQFLEAMAMTGGIQAYTDALLQDISFMKIGSGDSLMGMVMEAGGKSSYITEAKNRLESSLGRNHEQYLSVLQLISQGINSLPEIEKNLGGVKVGGHLGKLAGQYGLLERERPFFDDGRGRYMVVYRIPDPAVNFYLRFILSNSLWLSMGEKGRVKEKMAGDKEYRLEALRHALIEKIRGSGSWPSAGGQWGRGGDYEIIAVSGKAAMVGAVCLDAGDFEKDKLLKDIESFRKGPLEGFKIDAVLLTPSDL